MYVHVCFALHLTIYGFRLFMFKCLGVDSGSGDLCIIWCMFVCVMCCVVCLLWLLCLVCVCFVYSTSDQSISLAPKRGTAEGLVLLCLFTFRLTIARICIYCTSNTNTNNDNINMNDNNTKCNNNNDTLIWPSRGSAWRRRRPRWGGPGRRIRLGRPRTLHTT